jgi:hypothetical protein
VLAKSHTQRFATFLSTSDNELASDGTTVALVPSTFTERKLEGVEVLLLLLLARLMICIMLASVCQMKEK